MARILSIATLVAVAAAVATASQGWGDCQKQLIDPVDIPWQVPNAVRICREGYIAISYDVDMITPAVSCYYVTPDEEQSPVPGREAFYEDPDLQSMGVTQAAVDSSAFSDDWNRGHLAPSHLMSYTTASKHSCYTMANIAPQGGYFNQHPWADVEDKVQKWVAANKALYIITGVAYKDRSNPKRTADNIAVPDWYFKVICEPTTGNAAGFFGVNDPSTTTTTDFVPVDQIASMYGGQLFPKRLCNTSTVDTSFWGN